MNSKPFYIERLDDTPLPAIRLTDTAAGVQATILPAHGAILNAFSLPAGNERLEVVSGYTGPADLLRDELLYYRSAKLSPFVCRTAGGRYRLNDRVYEFPKKFTDGSAIHGLLSDRPFAVKEMSETDSAARLSLSHAYAGDNPGYPFPYEITVKYTLKKKGRLELETTVENLSVQTIPLADGWHPYFSLGGKANDWELLLQCREMLEMNAALIPSGKRLPLRVFRTPQLLGPVAFDNCFVADPQRGASPVAVLSHPGRRVSLSFFADDSYPFVQIYTPDDRESIAIENLSAAPDSFNNGIGLVLLAPGRKQTFTAAYQLGWS